MNRMNNMELLTKQQWLDYLEDPSNKWKLGKLGGKYKMLRFTLEEEDIITEHNKVMSYAYTFDVFFHRFLPILRLSLDKWYGDSHGNGHRHPEAHYATIITHDIFSSKLYKKYKKLRKKLLEKKERKDFLESKRNLINKMPPKIRRSLKIDEIVDV